MPYLNNILAETITEISPIKTILANFNLVVLLAGTIIIMKWLKKTDGGKNALIDSKPRRNNMPVYLPLLLISIWQIWNVVAILAIDFYSLKGRQKIFTFYAALSIIQLVIIFLIIAVGKKMFARRLTGFGLNAKTAFKDFFPAILCLLAILPVTYGYIYLVNIFGSLFHGEQFQIERHQSLVELASQNLVFLKLTISICAILITPLSEELIFRGILQTTLRNLDLKPWHAIFITSAIFAMLHPSTHFPAIFVLSVCFGYAYEKSGSLFRPIFIHMIFNASSIAATWINSPA